jgi:hypothetical protein
MDMKAISLDDILVKPKRVDIPIPSRLTTNEEGMPEEAKLSFWVRASRQPERDLAASAARKESRTLRKKLEDPESEEHQRLILDDLEDADDDSLRALWVNQKVIERAIRIRHASLENRDQTYIPEPEGDLITSKQIDDYENEVEEIEERREMGYLQAVEQAREELEEEVKKIDGEELLKLAIPVQIEVKVNEAYETAFVCQLVYRCTFKDQRCTKPAFSDIEQVYSLNDRAMVKLTNAHMAFLVDPEQVKNLVGGLRQ